MKKLCILLVLIIFILPFSTQASSFGISRPVNTLGLVGYWTFDGKDVVNGVSMDRSGNGNNGNLLNISTSTFYAQGKIGQGFRFDGVDDYVYVNQASPINNMSEMTISVWVKPNTMGSSQLAHIISKSGVSGSDGWSFYLDSNATKRFDFDAFHSVSPVMVHTGNNTVTLGVWQHVVATWNGAVSAGSAKIYKNGVFLTSSTAGSGTRTSDSGNDLTFGDRQVRSRSYDGLIDDIRIYNRVLSQSEITQLYNAGASNKISSSQKVTATTSCSVGLSCGLVGYWTLDGKDTNWGTNTVNDLSGNGNTGTISGMSTTSSPVVGKVGQGLRFDGNGQYITMGNTSSLQINGDITLCTWAYPKDISRFIFAKSDGGTRDYGMYISGSQFLTLFTSGGGTSGTRTITFNTWHHLCITVRSTAVTFYIDGSGEAGGSSASVTNSNKQFSLGRDGSSPGFDYNGFLDDTRVYNRALSATEIKSLYSQGASTKFAVSPKIATTTCSSGLSCGLVGYWTFDGKDTNWGTNRTTDMSGNSNTGTMVNMSTTSSPVVGKVGQGFKFDNATNYVNIPGFSGISGLNTASISLWAKPTTTSNGQAIISQWNSDRLFDFNTTGNVLNISWRYGGSGGTGSTLNLVTAPNNFVANVWQHYVFIYDNGTASVYRNGVFVTSVGGGGTLNSAINDPLRIGWNNIPGFFSGTIDDVRIYNRVLSQIDISSLYNIGR